MPKKGSRKKHHKKHSSLTDLKKECDTPRARLEKKVFKKLVKLIKITLNMFSCSILLLIVLNFKLCAFFY